MCELQRTERELWVLQTALKARNRLLRRTVHKNLISSRGRSSLLLFHYTLRRAVKTETKGLPEFVARCCAVREREDQYLFKAPGLNRSLVFIELWFKRRVKRRIGISFIMMLSFTDAFFNGITKDFCLCFEPSYIRGELVLYWFMMVQWPYEPKDTLIPWVSPV